MKNDGDRKEWDVRVRMGSGIIMTASLGKPSDCLSHHTPSCMSRDARESQALLCVG